MRTPRPLLMASALSLSLLAAFAACTAGEQSRSEATTPAATRAAATPSPLLGEPVLFAFSRTLPYVRYHREPLLAFQKSLVRRLGEPVQLRVSQYRGRDDATGETVLKGEILSVYYQESEASLVSLRSRADELVARLREAFPEPGAGDSLDIHARLPEGKTVADLMPELAEACGDRNTVRTGVALGDYQAGAVDDLYFALCDGARVLGPHFDNPEEPLVEEAWRLSEKP